MTIAVDLGRRAAKQIKHVFTADEPSGVHGHKKKNKKYHLLGTTVLIERRSGFYRKRSGLNKMAEQSTNAM